MPISGTRLLRQDDAVTDPELPPDVDSRLWIRTAGCRDRDYLWGNPHTFPGRMHAYCPHQRRDFAVSLSEVSEASREAELWMQGFLRGNEPAPPDDDDLRPVWLNSVQRFHETGVWQQPD